MKIIKVTKLNAAATLKKYRFVEKLRPVDINEYKCVFVVLSGQMYFSVYYTQVKSITCFNTGNLVFENTCPNKFRMTDKR